MTLGELLQRPSPAARRSTRRAAAAGRARRRATVVVGDCDSREVAPRLGVRRAARAQGRRRRVRPRGDRARRDRRSSPKRRRRPDAAVPWLQVADARLALAALAAAFFGNPSDRAGARRHHRHQRQDHDVVSARVDLRGRRHPVRPHRHGRLPRRPAARSTATRTTPEAPELQRMLREMVDERAAAPA